jgi:PST family polysaccharide transporter
VKPQNHVGVTGAAPADGIVVGPRIFKNITALIGGQGFNLGLSAAATVLLARYLGAAQLGEFGALYAYLGLYGWLSTFGLDSILARHVSQDRDQAGSILLTGVCVSSVFAVASAAIAFFLAPLFGYGGSLRTLLVFASIDILLLAPLRLPVIVFQVDLRQWYGVGMSLARQLVWLLVLVVMATARASLLWIILGRTSCALLEVVLIALAIHHKSFLARPWRFLPAQARSYLAYGFPVAMSTLAVGIYHRIDQVMLHKMVSDRILGSYVAAVRLTEFINVLPIAVMTSMFPILSQSANDEHRFGHYLQLSFRSLMVIALGTCFIIALFSMPIVHMLYGAKFDDAGPLLAVLIWSEVPVFFGVVISNGLVAKNLQNYLPIATGIGAVINVGLNLYLIPRWNATGAAWATNISYTVGGILFFFVMPRTRSIALVGFRILVRPCLLALFITLLFKAIHVSDTVRFAAALFLYFLGAWLLGIIKKSDMSHLSQLLGKNLHSLKTHVL